MQGRFYFFGHNPLLIAQGRYATELAIRSATIAPLATSCLAPPASWGELLFRSAYAPTWQVLLIIHKFIYIPNRRRLNWLNITIVNLIFVLYL